MFKWRAPDGAHKGFLILYVLRNETFDICDGNFIKCTSQFSTVKCLSRFLLAFLGRMEPLQPLLWKWEQKPRTSLHRSLAMWKHFSQRKTPGIFNHPCLQHRRLAASTAPGAQKRRSTATQSPVLVRCYMYGISFTAPISLPKCQRKPHHHYLCDNLFQWVGQPGLGGALAAGLVAPARRWFASSLV